MKALQQLPDGLICRIRTLGTRACRRDNLLRGALAILVCVLMAGCVPGQGTSLDVRAAKTNPGYVHLVPITPQVIAQQKAANPPATIPAALLDYRAQPYRIGPGDTLYITVWDHPQLTSPAGTQQQAAANGRVVQPNGTLFFPDVGELHAAGKTVAQLRQILAGKLSNYFKNPQVDISILTYASQHVLLEGAFTKTGPQSITSVPLTLGEAMGNAIVDDPNANLSDVMLSRGKQVYHLNIAGLERDGRARQIYLKAGDRVFLPYNNHQAAYVMGEVNRPEVVRFSTGYISLTRAIGAAGGLNQVTSKGKIYVIRNTSGNGTAHATVYELDARSVVGFALADQFEVKPGDVVFASAAGITRWNRFMTQLLPMASALNATAAAQFYIQRKP
ncbi:MAG TPA: polysaccharide biosynthesis/export family protein [Rhodanobacteraceae bacterium]